ncbi:hypothetical protein JIF05_004734 [Salmonella enterica]|nr:hypothetical protein [Salmonella enterica]
MFKKSLLAATLIFGALSTASFAGGGGASWQPSVEPINCVVGDATKFSWRDSKDCNDVITNKYAKGVQYSGQFWYEDGSKQSFDALLNPTNSYTPKHPQGKKVRGIINTTWSWLR